MARAFVFGSGFDSLANQRQALNRFHFDVASRNEANRLAAAEASHRLGLAAQAQADEVAARNASFNLAGQQAALQAASNAARNQEAGREFAINTALKVADDIRAQQTAIDTGKRAERDFRFKERSHEDLQASRDRDALNRVLSDINDGNTVDKDVLESQIEGLPDVMKETARKQLVNADKRKREVAADTKKEVDRLNRTLPEIADESGVELTDEAWLRIANSLNANPDIAVDVKNRRFVRRLDIPRPPSGLVSPGSAPRTPGGIVLNENVVNLLEGLRQRAQ